MYSSSSGAAVYYIFQSSLNILFLKLCNAYYWSQLLAVNVQIVLRYSLPQKVELVT